MRDGARRRSRSGIVGVSGSRVRVVVVAALALLVAALVASLVFDVFGRDEEGEASRERPSEGATFNPAMAGGGTVRETTDESTDESASGEYSSQDDSSQDDSSQDDSSQEVSGDEGRTEPSPEEPERGADHDEEYVDLTDSQKGRARLAAIDFIIAAYGYPEDDWIRYNERIRAEVDPRVFYESAAGDEISQRVVTMREEGESGLTGAVVVERFEVGEVEGSGESEQVNGVAYFEAAESFSPEGEAEGRTADYRQRMRLAADGETYLVRSAEVPEEVR